MILLSKPEKVQKVCKYVLKIVCDYFGEDYKSVSEIKKKSRKREYVMCRQFAMKLLNENTRISSCDVGYNITRKDHSTVLHSCQVIQNLIDTDRQVRHDYEYMLKKLSVLFDRFDRDKDIVDIVKIKKSVKKKLIHTKISTNVHLFNSTV